MMNSREQWHMWTSLTLSLDGRPHTGAVRGRYILCWTGVLSGSGGWLTGRCWRFPTNDDDQITDKVWTSRQNQFIWDNTALTSLCDSVVLPAENSPHLQQGCYCATGVPQHGGQVRYRLPLLAELQEGILPGLWTGQLIDPLVDLFSVHLCQCCGYSLKAMEKM